MNPYLDLFVTFTRVGACLFGGGYAMLPLLQREIVEKKHWATEEELTDYFAIGQCTPGVIAVNTATFVGAKRAGTLGGVVATLGLVFPPLVFILLIAAFLQNFAEYPAVIHAFAGVRACVCVLLFNAVRKLVKTTVIDRRTAGVYFAVLALALVSSFADLSGVWAFLVSPAVLVVLAGLVGFGMKGRRA